MTGWFTQTIVETGRLPLFSMMAGLLLAFLFIRFSTRMIRAEVRWWPGNVTPGGLHVHHIVFGLVIVLVSGFSLVALADYHTPVANVTLAAGFGIGTALVLDEFAMVLYLRDVYWTSEGRASIDAVFAALAITVLFILGLHPVGLSGEFSDYAADRQLSTLVTAIVVLTVQYALAVVVLLKGKIWTGLIGLFVPVLLIVGACRLARPQSLWAHWFYRATPGKRQRSLHRERRYRDPVLNRKIRIQEAVAGRFDLDIRDDDTVSSSSNVQKWSKS
ncbi:hypothetical protein GOHSU_29_00570 [Gordonia hirsuta DSM 44140 = NBRC 16056]|uniref:Integral membrane protein n=1 Tax=Gordonia hirsuta DSM 44140 = NBRC 16056 TaxID=1121927 RepID=L7LAZ4_9ACTN|nr:hypothetical protein [Gordonia hirsuta]GAC58074.1 hypothetical protein GOHSU_29_00570 [Gordonia hirsuta DSM 44140 = NBRC 16056]